VLDSTRVRGFKVDAHRRRRLAPGHLSQHQRRTGVTHCANTCCTPYMRRRWPPPFATACRLRPSHTLTGDPSQPSEW